MKKLFIMVLLAGLICVGADVIEIPEDFATIQGAVDFAVDGDEVIVSPGIYYESVNFMGKAITVASLFYTTQDTSYISQTIIDGGMIESVVLFDSGEGVNSILTGFTITHGFTENSGGGIFAGDNCSPTLSNLRITANQAENYGGGFYIGESCSPVMSDLLIEGNSAHYGGGGAYDYYCDLIMEDSVIRDNEGEYAGGGIFCQVTDLQLENVVIENNTSQNGGGIYFDSYYYSEPATQMRNVFISHNEANRGGGVFANGRLLIENVIITENSAVEKGGGLLCYSDSVVFAEENSKLCSIYLNECEGVIGRDIYSDYNLQNVHLATFTVMEPTLFYAYPMDLFTFDIQSSAIEQIDADLYISPEGDDENSGLSSAEPFKTINRAMAVIHPNDQEPHTIHLAEGVYNNSDTGEVFPVYIPHSVSLMGTDRDSVILDAEDTGGGIHIEAADNVYLSNITVKNGNSSGVRCLSSGITMEKMNIYSNWAVGGGGIDCSESSAVFNDIIIADNDALHGAGMSLYNNINCLLKNLTFYGNAAQYDAGALYSSISNTQIINCIMWNNSPREITLNGENSTMSIAYSDIKHGVSEINNQDSNLNWLEGNINEIPDFIDGTNKNFELLPESPCIDAGTAYFEYEGMVFVDLAEDEYYGLSPDMGACEYVVLTEEEDVIENGKLKMENYPNPFNPVTAIAYQLPQAGNVKIDVFNVKGQKVTELVNEQQDAGNHTFIWNADKFNSGVYFISLTNGTYRKTNKVVLLK